MFFRIAAAGCHGGITQRALLDEAFRVITVLDILERSPHRFAGAIIDNRFARDVFAIFRIIRDLVIHIGDAAFID